MSQFVAFLNANAGVLNLVFGGLVAASTVVYAWLTAKLVKETRLVREAETEPRIEVFYRPRDEWISLIDVVVRNIGSGPAYDLTFTWCSTTNSKGSDALVKKLEEIKGLKTGLTFLGPQQEFFSLWTQMTEHHEDKLQTQILISSSCRSASGQLYRWQHTLDISELKGVVRIGEPPLLKLAKHMEKLQRDIHDLVTEFRKLKIDVFDHEDRERQIKERQEICARIRDAAMGDENAP